LSPAIAFATCSWSSFVSRVRVPLFPHGNIYAPVMMTAEKAADLIAGNTPLPAEAVEFYRHPG
jgi:hypothetical protein